MIATRFNQHQPLQSSELILRSDGSLYHLGILPEDVADKIIIVGDPERVAMISNFFDQVEIRKSSREFVVHTGTYSGKRITIVSSGIGVDNIDIVINELDAAVNIDLASRTFRKDLFSLEIVRLGTSGALHPEIKPGSVVASSMAFGLDGVPNSYDVAFTPREESLMAALRSNFEHLATDKSLYAAEASTELMDRLAGDAIQGITATANGFYGPQGRSLRLHSKMSPMIDGYASFVHETLKITNFEMECSGIYALASMLGHKPLTLCTILANRATKEFHNNPSTSIESLIRLALERF